MPKNNFPGHSHSQLDTPTKNRIVGYASATGNAAEAGHKENVDPRTAQRICKCFKETHSTARKQGSGRPTKLTDQDQREIVRNARKNRRITLRELRNQATANISTSTVRRVLADKGYHRRVAKKVPYLTRSYQKKCRATKIPTVYGLPPHLAEPIHGRFSFEKGNKIGIYV